MKNEIVFFLVGFLNLHLVLSHPAEKVVVGGNVRSVTNTDSKSVKEQLKDVLATSIPATKGYQVSPDSGIMDHGPADFQLNVDNSRQRRSAGKEHSPDLQSLFPGNWAGGQQNPDFARFLDLLARDPVFSSEVEYPEPNDDAINLFAKNPYPLTSESIPNSKTVVHLLAEPISLSSGKKHNTDEDPIPLNVNRLKKSGHAYPAYVKRSYYGRRSVPLLGHDLDFYYPLPYQNEKKDFTMLPNGEIALTRHGLYSLQNLLRPPQIEEGVPVIHRPIL